MTKTKQPQNTLNETNSKETNKKQQTSISSLILVDAHNVPSQCSMHALLIF